MDDWLPVISPFLGVGLAFALGLLIGVERGWSQRLEPDGSRVAGIRTMALLGLAGGLAGVVGTAISPLLGAALVLAAAAPLLIGYARAASRGDFSATTAVVGAVTLAVGMLAASGHRELACVSAAVTTVVLVQRKALHAWLGRLSEPELQAIARFALISLAVAPLLPDKDLGPLGAWNPHQIWMVVILVSGLSLVGYAIGKRLGPGPGWLATAAAGALVSSTAATTACAARLRQGGDEAIATAGIAFASAIMFARVMVLVALLVPFALAPLACVAGPAGLLSAGYAWLAYSRRRAAAEAPGAYEAKNPFDLAPALVLAALVMAISLAARWAMSQYGDAGLVTALGVSGMVDVDAAIVSMSGLSPGALQPLTAGLILTAPILANTFVKAVIAASVGGGRRGLRAAIPLVLSLAAGAAGAAAAALLIQG